jgi:chemotaxis protein CheZ
MEKTNNADERLAQAQALVASLEAGDEPEADRIIKELSSSRDDDLFQEVGRLTRELHEAIVGFLLDDRIAQFAQHEIPDAAERLKHVITMTEEAAHKTLSAVEDSLPVAEELESRANDLGERWAQFRNRKLDLDDFRALSSEIVGFLDLANAHSQTLHGKLSEVLMAQGYQDLTGQIIRRVINLVQDVEEKLVRLVAISGTARAVKQEEVELEGPAVPGVTKGDVITNQDDVDDLLSSLGF